MSAPLVHCCYKRTKEADMPKDPAFPDRLQRLMDQKKMTRAELARHIWGTMVDERGYTVARNRQTVSRYLAGKTDPNETTKRLIAEALGVTYKQLYPNDDPVNRPGSGVTLTSMGSQRCRVDISLELPMDVATQVIQLVSEYAT
jgi:transcriptional regulator with XRE-family HTH domain